MMIAPILVRSNLHGWVVPLEEVVLFELQVADSMGNRFSELGGEYFTIIFSKLQVRKRCPEIIESQITDSSFPQKQNMDTSYLRKLNHI